MKITELRNRKSVKFRGQAMQMNVYPIHHQAARRYENGIGTDGQGTSGHNSSCASQENSPIHELSAWSKIHILALRLLTPVL
jgi:hypothetical protein